MRLHLVETSRHLKASTDLIRPSIFSFPISSFIIFFLLPFEHAKLINAFLSQRNKVALLKSSRASGHGKAFFFFFNKSFNKDVCISLAALQ